jgi:hypothetical protein
MWCRTRETGASNTIWSWSAMPWGTRAVARKAWPTAPNKRNRLHTASPVSAAARACTANTAFVPTVEEVHLPGSPSPVGPSTHALLVDVRDGVTLRASKFHLCLALLACTGNAVLVPTVALCPLLGRHWIWRASPATATSTATTRGSGRAGCHPREPSTCTPQSSRCLG